MDIRKATIEDAKELTELTIRSKSYWGYSSQQIENWKEELTVSETCILENEVFKLVSNNNIIGYYYFFRLNDSDIKLENLFVETKFIGRGIGKKLMIDFFKRIQKEQFVRIILDADPNAEIFYKKLGFKVIGKLETSIKNRFLSIMEIKKDSIQQWV